MNTDGLRRVGGLGAAALLLLLAAAPARADEDTLGPKPAKCGIGCWADAPNSLAVSRLGDMTVSPHIARPGKKITATFTPLGDGLTWDWGIRGCKANKTTCTFRAAPTDGWAVLTLGIGNPIGPAESQDTYAVPSKNTAIIDGFVTDKSGGGIAGASVTAKGPGGIHHVTTGGDGFYNMVVKPGRYTVTPSGGPKTGHEAKYYPEDVDRSVAKGENARADFILQAGLQVSLTFDRSTVPADGFQVVAGTLKTTRFGKPAPHITVSLRPQSTQGTAAALQGPRAAICPVDGGGPIWPSGGAWKPNGEPVDVSTGDDGTYRFVLAAGTVPGAFSVDAWAKDGYGKLITDDLKDVSQAQTLTMTSLGGATTDGFAQELDVLAQSGNAVLGAIGWSPGSIYETLAQLTAATPSLGGIAFGHGNTTSNGDNIVVYNAATPPHVGPDGTIAPGASNAYVIQPNAWRGTPAIPLTDFQKVLQQGRLQNLPQLRQLIAGSSDVPGWNLTATTESQLGSALEGFGWGYGAGRTGGCA
jgi:hypothetical protein